MLDKLCFSVALATMNLFSLIVWEKGIIPSPFLEEQKETSENTSCFVKQNFKKVEITFLGPLFV